MQRRMSFFLKVLLNKWKQRENTIPEDFDFELLLWMINSSSVSGRLCLLMTSGSIQLDDEWNQILNIPRIMAVADERVAVLLVLPVLHRVHQTGIIHVRLFLLNVLSFKFQQFVQGVARHNELGLLSLKSPMHESECTVFSDTESVSTVLELPYQFDASFFQQSSPSPPGDPE